jgi:hypothetical protein
MDERAKLATDQDANRQGERGTEFRSPPQMRAKFVRNSGYIRARHDRDRLRVPEAGDLVIHTLYRFSNGESELN